jgi:hypothetical protein
MRKVLLIIAGITCGAIIALQLKLMYTYQYDMKPQVETLIQASDDITDAQLNLEDQLRTTQQLVHGDNKIVDYQIEGLPPGYYIITNVFAVHSNTIKWKQHLKNLGYNPKVFKHPQNNWEYVYVFKSINWDRAFQRYKSIKDIPDIRLGAINM